MFVLCMFGHYLNQCWFTVNCTLSNTLWWHFYGNSNFFKNTFQNVICKMGTWFWLGLDALTNCQYANLAGDICWYLFGWWYLLISIWLVIFVDIYLAGDICWYLFGWWYLLISIWLVIFVDIYLAGDICWYLFGWWYLLISIWLVIFVDIYDRLSSNYTLRGSLAWFPNNPGMPMWNAK